MKNNLLFIVACLHATFFTFAQTDEQKQMMFEKINSESRIVGLVSKAEPIANKEELFKNAQVFPIYKMDFNDKKEPKLIQNKNYFLVFYKERLYMFLNKKNSRFFENSLIIQSIKKFNEENKKIKFVYFTENYSFNGKHIEPIIINESLDLIYDNEKYFKIMEYVEKNYGNYEKYKELKELDDIREKLTLKDFDKHIENYYKKFEYNCPKDTTLVIKKLIGNIKFLNNDFTESQENTLFNKIYNKINPFKEVEKILLQNNKKENDSVIKKSIEKSRIEFQEKNKKNRLEENYGYSIYNINITSELLEVLTNNQFLNFKNHIDIFNPISIYSKKFRYAYGTEILIKEGLLKSNDYKALNNYENKILEKCGCPYDESIKREMIIR